MITRAGRGTIVAVIVAVIAAFTFRAAYGSLVPLDASLWALFAFIGIIMAAAADQILVYLAKGRKQ